LSGLLLRILSGLLLCLPFGLLLFVLAPFPLLASSLSILIVKVFFRSVFAHHAKPIEELGVGLVGEFGDDGDAGGVRLGGGGGGGDGGGDGGVWMRVKIFTFTSRD
jgi:hypothetical protein